MVRRLGTMMKGRPIPVKRKNAKVRFYNTYYTCKECGDFIGITKLGSTWCKTCCARKSRDQMIFTTFWREKNVART